MGEIGEIGAMRKITGMDQYLPYPPYFPHHLYPLINSSSARGTVFFLPE
jgi:hypothetical protein